MDSTPPIAFATASPSIAGMALKALKIGDYTLVRDRDRLLLLHPALKEPVELPEHLLLVLFKRITREALTL